MQQWLPHGTRVSLPCAVVALASRFIGRLGLCRTVVRFLGCQVANNQGRQLAGSTLSGCCRALLAYLHCPCFAGSVAHPSLSANWPIGSGKASSDLRVRSGARLIEPTVVHGPWGTMLPSCKVGPPAAATAGAAWSGHVVCRLSLTGSPFCAPEFFGIRNRSSWGGAVKNADS